MLKSYINLNYLLFLWLFLPKIEGLFCWQCVLCAWIKSYLTYMDALEVLMCNFFWQSKSAQHFFESLSSPLCFGQE